MWTKSKRALAANQHLLVLACLSCLAATGCGGRDDVERVTGTITMDGKPLANASVVFAPESGRPAGARTDENGYYELNFTERLKGAMLGKNRVMISTAADPSETEDGQPIPAQPETVPIRYNANSELEFTVEKDKENTADFDLTSEGDLPAKDSLISDADEEDSGE